jgi:hypothetical protein
MRIEIKIEPTHSTGWPNLRLSVNRLTLFDGECRPNEGEYFKWTHYADDNSLSDSNKLYIEHYGKDGKETRLDEKGEAIADKALILRSIKIDEYDIPEVILYNQPFHVKWTSSQLKENKNRPRSIINNLYFGYNGIYEYEFSNDSVKDYYKNLFEKERLANIANKKTITRTDGKIVEAYEFQGELIDGTEPTVITIEDLYKKVQNEI